MRSPFRSTAAKVLVGFILGATVVGGVAVAGTFSNPLVKACVDIRTQALYASTDGSCPKTRTAVDLGSSGSGSIKSIVQKVSPSVVSVDVRCVATEEMVLWTSSYQFCYNHW